MTKLPGTYEKYLAQATGDHAEALRLVFLESAAEELYGVLVRGIGTKHVQAMVDERIPYGEIREVRVIPAVT